MSDKKYALEKAFQVVKDYEFTHPGEKLSKVVDYARGIEDFLSEEREEAVRADFRDVKKFLETLLVNDAASVAWLLIHEYEIRLKP